MSKEVTVVGWGVGKLHAINIERLGYEVVQVVDVDTRHQTEILSGKWENIWNGEVDGVAVDHPVYFHTKLQDCRQTKYCIIAVPEQLHTPLAIEAKKMGMERIFVEKPGGFTRVDAAKLCGVADMIGYVWNFVGGFESAKDLVVEYAECRKVPGYLSWENPLVDLGCHAINILKVHKVVNTILTAGNLRINFEFEKSLLLRKIPMAPEFDVIRDGVGVHIDSGFKKEMDNFLCNRIPSSCSPAANVRVWEVIRQVV